MMKLPSLTATPNHRETLLGLLWLAISLAALPRLAQILPLSPGKQNLVMSGVNLLAIICIFFSFLKENGKIALKKPLPVLFWAGAAYLLYLGLTQLVTALIFNIYPEFVNLNDQNIRTMLDQDLCPLGVSAVLLVPITEEVLYRGLLFSKLHERYPVLSYFVSMIAFSAIHLLGYGDSLTPMALVLSFLQYLPAGFCLIFCYRLTGTVFAPILMHLLVNFTGIYHFVR